MASFTKIPTIADVSNAGRCTYTGERMGPYHQDQEQCRHLAYHLIPQGQHCRNHLTSQEIATVLPRIAAWTQGIEDLYSAVTTMGQGKVPVVSVSIELTEGDPV